MFFRQSAPPFEKPTDGPSLGAVLDHLPRLGLKRLGLLVDGAAEPDLPAVLRSLKNVCVIDVSGKADARALGVPVYSVDAAASKRVVDAAVIANNAHVPILMRKSEKLFAAGIAVVPGDPAAVVADSVRLGTPQELVWKWVGVEYVGRSGLTGHYLEFGTFWGSSFFKAYHFLKGWLKGDFYAFDSFEGLSTPLADENRFTGGDFYEGAYACNVKSFETIGNLVGMDSKRLEVVKGFYRDTLVGRRPKDYGLEPGSVSICVVDCDLFEPSLEVLEFVRPLLADGALVYFDDWRLCRASPKVGERAAALEWMRRHPEIELVELHRDHWQHQWFIYHSR